MSETIEWDEEVRLEVTMKVKAKANPEYFDGVLGRTPYDLAYAALITGRDDPARIDGFADLVGQVDIEFIEKGF